LVRLDAIYRRPGSKWPSPPRRARRPVFGLARRNAPAIGVAWLPLVGAQCLMTDSVGKYDRRGRHFFLARIFTDGPVRRLGRCSFQARRCWRLMCVTPRKGTAHRPPVPHRARPIRVFARRRCCFPTCRIPRRFRSRCWKHTSPCWPRSCATTTEQRSRPSETSSPRSQIRPMR
jgi:hypothetical protein